MVATMQTLNKSKAAGMSPADSTMCATAVSELATNIVRYAGKGSVHLKFTHDALYITATDSGPGIANIDEALLEGYSGGSGLGKGLAGVARIMDSMHIQSSAKKGTRIEASKRFQYLTNPEQKHTLTHATKWVDVAIKSTPFPGELLNGDGIIAHKLAPYKWMALWDVSGHGRNAHVLSMKIKEFLLLNMDKQPHKLVQALHDKFRGSRGLVAVIARLNIDSGWLDYAGVGNVSLLHISATASPNHAMRRLSLKDGVIGNQIRTPVNQRLKLHQNDILIMHSDGICSIRQPLQFTVKTSAEQLTTQIMTNFQAKQADDMSCLVLRYRYGAKLCI